MSGRRSPLSAVGRVLAYPARHIRWKIIAPYVVLTAVIAGGGTYLAAQQVTGTLEERFENQLAEAARVASDSVVRRERDHLAVVRTVAFTSGMDFAVEVGAAEQVEKLVYPVAANSGSELVEVLNANGDRVVGMKLNGSDAEEPYTLVDDDTDYASMAAVQNLLAGRQDELGDKFAQVVETPYGYALYTAGPIYDGDRIVGAVLVGSLFSSLLPAIKAESLADVTVYDFDGAPLGSTFAEPQDDEEADLTPDPAVVADETEGGAYRESKTLFGRDFDLLYGELLIRDQSVGRYSVALPSSFILSAGNSTRWQMGLLFAAATAAVLLTGYLLARSLTRPLLRLVGAARAVTGGDLTARSGVRTSDEVGVLATSFDAMTERLQRQHLATIKALTSAIDARDPYTAGHSARVGQLSVMLGAEFELPLATLQHLEIGGYLHDIGKIGVRDAVLLKPGRLTPEERDLIERHPQVGLDILESVDLAPEVVAFVKGHHEKLDGSGYPEGIGANEIGMIQRIAAIADIYDALTTDRPYRGALSREDAIGIMRREAMDGKLDMEVLAVFERVSERWEWRRRTDPALQGFRLPDDPLKRSA
jgi:putative nucleotidyltransferase with HDIG domain